MLTQNEVGAFVGFETEIQEVLLMGEIGQTGRDWEGWGVGLGELGGAFWGDWEGLGALGRNVR